MPCPSLLLLLLSSVFLLVLLALRGRQAEAGRGRRLAGDGVMVIYRGGRRRK
jgi:hypothetical protein